MQVAASSSRNPSRAASQISSSGDSQIPFHQQSWEYFQLHVHSDRQSGDSGLVSGMQPLILSSGNGALIEHRGYNIAALLHTMKNNAIEREKQMQISAQELSLRRSAEARRKQEIAQIMHENVLDLDFPALLQVKTFIKVCFLFIVSKSFYTYRIKL